MLVILQPVRSLKSCTTTLTKVAIVGGGQTEKLAPFDSDYEIWVTAIRHKLYPRVDRVFEVHDPELYGQQHIEELNALKVPLVRTSDKLKGELFPFEKVDVFEGTYLTSTIAYMIAYAIYLEVDEIAIFGVDMAVDNDEYFYQQPCVMAWIGYAKGKGIKVTAPESSLMRSKFVYGFDYREKTPPFTSDGFEHLAREHAEMVEQLQGQIAHLETKVHSHEGARQAYDRMMKVARAVEGGQVIEHLKDTAKLR